MALSHPSSHTDTDTQPDIAPSLHLQVPVPAREFSQCARFWGSKGGPKPLGCRSSIDQKCMKGTPGGLAISAGTNRLF